MKSKKALKRDVMTIATVIILARNENCPESDIRYLQGFYNGIRWAADEKYDPLENIILKDLLISKLKGAGLVDGVKEVKE